MSDLKIARNLLEADPVSFFALNALQPSKGVHVHVRAVYATYCLWGTDRGLDPISRKTFGTMMFERGYRRSLGCPVVYQDTMLTPEWEARLSLHTNGVVPHYQEWPSTDLPTHRLPFDFSINGDAA